MIHKQTNEGMIKKVNETKTLEKGKELYLPHRPVIRESAETTKIRIVYNVSARPSKNSVLLNEGLEPGPSLQNSLWDILRPRFRPILLNVDIKKVSLQIRIRKSKTDLLRFH